MIHDSPLIPSRLGERDGDKAIAARKSAADATRRASGLDKPIPVNAFATYTAPDGGKHPCRVRQSWKGLTGWVYVVVTSTGSELTAVSGDRLERRGE